ncbi:hypothetical protein [Kribbella sp. NPDC051770]|uniref:hypothetical protein n=1 Tax=Kribbella sp. NPDC051770 TaxID=3155413 RepID=UPI0034194C9D
MARGGSANAEEDCSTAGAGSSPDVETDSPATGGVGWSPDGELGSPSTGSVA